MHTNTQNQKAHPMCDVIKMCRFDPTTYTILCGRSQTTIHKYLSIPILMSIVPEIHTVQNASCDRTCMQCACYVFCHKQTPFVHTCTWLRIMCTLNDIVLHFKTCTENYLSIAITSYNSYFSSYIQYVCMSTNVTIFYN